uniref:Mitogen-activated protein kinase kinase kinase kinase n=1 Tax=Eptatretus burgeri TaxID=7764 RepID=A0A8C4WPK0_EPTBU
MNEISMPANKDLFPVLRLPFICTRARNVHTSELSAIKVIKVEPGDDFAVIQQEILMMKDCNHQNIVAYFGSYLRYEKLWICMEYCGGGSLQDIYHVTGSLSEKQIAYVCRETLKGLAYLHMKNKMHRDIKGANILLTDNGNVKLADFGVSAKITATIAKRMSFIGTPYWMAPEVAAVERLGGYNQQCDVWAVGITAIELAELQPPMFDLHPMRALLLMSKSNFLPPKLKEKQKWNPIFHNFVKHALIKNPKKRPTAEKMLQDAFIQQPLTRVLAVELLDQMKSPMPRHFSYPDDEEIEPIALVPHRIASLKFQPDVIPTPPYAVNAPKPIQRSPEFCTVHKNVPVLSSSFHKMEIDKDQGDHECLPGKDENDSDGTLKQVPPPLPPKPIFMQPAESPSTIQHKPRHGSHDDRYLPIALPQQLGGPPMYRPPQYRSHPVLVPPPAYSPRSDQVLPPPSRNSHPQLQDQNPPPLPPHWRLSGRNVQPPPVPQRSLSSSPPVRPPLPGSDQPLALGQAHDRPEKPTIPQLSQIFHKEEQTEDLTDQLESPPELLPRDDKEGMLKLQANGLPPTPKVHMGACFLKIFNGCPLTIHCATSWIHPDTRDQYLIFGADEGIYTINLNELHEAAMEQLVPRKCTWLYVMKNVLMSVSGKVPYLYSHALLVLFEQARREQRLPVISDMWARRNPTSRIAETKGCRRCCADKNVNTGNHYLCSAMQSSLVLLQWYDPLQKFMMVKHFDFPLPSPLHVFEFLFPPSQELPLVCFCLSSGSDDGQDVHFETINLNSASSWFTAVEHGLIHVGVTHINQMLKDTVVVALDNTVKLVNLQGKLKQSKKLISELTFNFQIDALVCLQDSVLAFWKHGMQGRSIRNSEITQEISDRTRVFNLLGSESVVVLESRPTENPAAHSNLYILAGHESTY